MAALLLCGWYSIAPLPIASSGEAPQADASAGSALIHLHGGRLSVRLHHAPWAVVLQELEHCTGARIIVASPLSGTLTHEFSDLPLEQGLRRLFREVNRLILFAPGETAGGSAVTVTHVWLFSKEEHEAGQPEVAGAREQLSKQLLNPARGTPTAEAVTEGELAERRKALHTFAEQGNLEALQQALLDPNPFIQGTAFALFAERNRQGTIASLLGLIASEQPEQRWQALQLLHQSGAVDEETVPAALHTALADEDTTVKSYAIQALVKRGGKEALEYLHQAFRDPDPAIRRLVIESVIQLDEGHPLVQEALTGADETIRALARSRLETAGSEPW